MNRIIIGDCRTIMRRWADEGVQVQTCVTSPPYFGLRDYGVDGQIGLEPTPDEYVAALVEVFREVRRLLRDDGTLWLNLGDSYAASRSYQVTDNKNPAVGPSRHSARATPPPGLKQKDLIGIPWRVAFALQADGWWLRQDIIWAKPNPMPESVTDRCTKSHEYLFLLAKSERYYFDQRAIAEPATERDWQSRSDRAEEGQKSYPTAQVNGIRSRSGNKERKPGSACGCPEGTGSNVCGSVPWEGTTRNKRSVWTVTTKPFKGAHFATFPPDLIEPCVLAGSRPGDIVLDPFMGTGTTAQVAQALGRQYLGTELNPAYEPLQRERTAQQGLVL